MIRKKSPSKGPKDKENSALREYLVSRQKFHETAQEVDAGCERLLSVIQEGLSKLEDENNLDDNTQTPSTRPGAM